MPDQRSTRGFRKSAVAMMMVAGGLAAPATTYPPPSFAQASKDSAAIPCDMIKEERKARKKAGAMNPCQVGARKQGGLMNPCEVKAAK